MREIGVGVDADFAGDAHGFLRDVFRVHFGVFARARAARKRIGAAGADGANAVVGFDHVAIAGEQKRAFRVGHDQQRIQMAQRAVGAPFLGELDGRARQIAVIFLQLVFEAREERKRVGRAARKSREILSLNRRRVFFALCLITPSPMVTWPSPASTTLLSLRTHRTVVPCICTPFCVCAIERLYL